MLCGEGALVNVGVNRLRATVLRCRSWTCEWCSYDRRRQLTAQAIDGNPNTFITLTVDPSRFQTPLNRARELVIAWRHVVKRAKKEYGYRSIPYLCVFEATKRGEPHLHILCRVPWIKQKWLSKQMVELIGAPIVDIRRITNSSMVAGYVAKYVGKAPHKFGTCKRYWQTTDYSQRKWEAPEKEWFWEKGWEVSTETVEELETKWKHWGYEVVPDKWGIYASLPDPPRSNRYDCQV